LVHGKNTHRSRHGPSTSPLRMTHVSAAISSPPLRSFHAASSREADLFSFELTLHWALRESVRYFPFPRADSSPAGLLSSLHSHCGRPAAHLRLTITASRLPFQSHTCSLRQKFIISSGCHPTWFIRIRITDSRKKMKFLTRPEQEVVWFLNKECISDSLEKIMVLTLR